MYNYLAESLYNIQVSLDPEMIIIGGGISGRDEFIDELRKQLYNYLAKRGLRQLCLRFMLVNTKMMRT
ncbi:hypothetical protein GCM10025857_56140 [Alicyclobacillus contaminans]|nr:hypothetical protein GCM10025857_56140 [Alicyclobacillus contaminans]